MRPTRVVSMLLLFLVAALTAEGLAGGKIKGRVIDKSSKEPLIGANVVVEATTYGSAAGVQGEFAILDLPAGVYTLKASYVGYTPVELENIRVYFGLTTEVEFELPSQEIAVQAITVFAQRPLVNTSSTNAFRVTTSDDIKNIPVRGLDNVIALQPGIILQDGEIHIRGSRIDEVGYYLEGVSVTDPQYGGRGITLVQDAVEEISIQSAGYEAEFGRANAGIIQHQLKSGGSSWHVSLEGVTDNVAFQGKGQRYNGEKRLGAYWYGYNELTTTFGGPVLDERIRFFGLFNYNYQRDKNPEAYKGIDIGPVKDPVNGDSVNLVYPAGQLLKNSNESYSFTGTLTTDLNPLRLRLSGSYTTGTAFRGAYPYEIMDLDRIPETDWRNGFASLKATYFINPTTFVEVSGGIFASFSKTLDPVLRDDFMAYGDSVANAQAGYVWIRRESESPGRYNVPWWPAVYAWTFAPFGYPLSGYTKIQRNNISLNGAFSTQVGGHHTLKGGGDYQRYTIRTYDVPYVANLARGIDLNNKITDVTQRLSLEQLLIQWGVNDYGYDVLGNEINTNDFVGPRHPVFASAYLQDRMEYGDLVINLGFRYDYINTKSTPFVDPTRPELTIDRTTNQVNPNGIGVSTPFQAVSPRLGAAFPVSDRTVFHVQYAKMVQQPRLRDVNLGLYAVASQLFWGGSTTPIGFDLRPTRTTQYEIGFSQQVGEFASFDLTGYYRDIRDEITMRLVTPAHGSSFIPYAVYANGDFATTKGVELAFTMRRLDRLQATASLSFQNAQGSGSFPNSNRAVILAGLNAAFNPQYISPLSYNHSVRGNFNIDYRFRRDDGGPILQELGASLLFTFNSGHPYTRIRPESNEYAAVTRRPAEALNSSTTPWVYQVDLRVDKTFRILDRLSATLYLYVINLLDIRNITNVYMMTGSPEDDGWLSDPTKGQQYIETYGPLFADFYNAMNQYTKPVAYFSDPYFYGTPRQIRLGLRIEY
jgi:hypothetical protein